MKETNKYHEYTIECGYIEVWESLKDAAALSETDPVLFTQRLIHHYKNAKSLHPNDRNKMFDAAAFALRKEFPIIERK